MIYCFYLFDRDGVCLYYEDWNRSVKPKSLPGSASRWRPAQPQCKSTHARARAADAARSHVASMLTRVPAPRWRPRTEEQKLIFGLLFSLKATVCAMRPGGDGKSTVDGLQVCARQCFWWERQKLEVRTAPGVHHLLFSPWSAPAPARRGG
jgi:hypothetical protein